MREIKFRVWDVKAGEMIYPMVISIIHDPEFNDYCEGMAVRLDDEDLMEFTGLLDSNGKEIYEGDRVKFLFDNQVIEGNVIFEKGCFVVAFRYWPQDCAENRSRLSSVLLHHAKECEVIGNIFEGEING